MNRLLGTSPAVLLASAIVAQPLTLQFADLANNPLVPTQGYSVNAMATGDVDADGDGDVILVGAKLVLLLNDGLGRLQDASAGRIPASAPAGNMVALGDLDRDGDLDLVQVVFAFGNRLYLNDGTGTFVDRSATHLPAATDLTLALALGDVDRDGDLDLLFGNGANCVPCPGQPNKLLLNDGRGVFSDASAGRLPVDTDVTRAMALGDVDLDGDLDLIIGRDRNQWNGSKYTGGQDALYLNDGTGTFHDATATWLPADDADTRCLALGDVDADGDLDLMAGDFDWSGPPWPVRLLHNVRTGFVDVTATAMGGIAGLCTGLSLSDMDADGDHDLVLGSQVAKTLPAVHLNNGLGQFNPASATGLPPGDLALFVNAMLVVDLDRDGDADVLAGELGQPLRLFLGAPRGLLVDPGASAMPLPPGASAGILTRALAAVDLDGDLAQDIISARISTAFFQSAVNATLRNDGRGSFADVSATTLPTDYGQPGDLVAADFDADGDPDLLFGNQPYYAPHAGFVRGDNTLYVNDGRGLFTLGTGMPADADATQGVAVADIDRDGDLDFVAANDRGASKLYVNHGRGNFTRSLGLSSPSEDAKAVAFADADADGNPDLVFGNYGQDRLYLNDGRGSFTDVTSTHLPVDADSTNAVLLRDFDGDGDLDLILAGVGQDRLCLNDGRGVFGDVTATHMPVDADATDGVQAQDLDDDGDYDLVRSYLGATGRYQLSLYRNDGSGRFTDVSSTALPPHQGDPGFTLFDADGDGDFDLATATKLLVNLHRHMHSTDAVRPGSISTWELFAKPGYASGPQALAPFASPRFLSPPLLLPPLGRLYLDPTALIPLPAVVIGAPGGKATLTLTLPQDPTLRGAALYVQALTAHSFSLADARLSNTVADLIH